MKNKISAFIILFILTGVYSYQLKNLWLDPSNSYTLYLDQSMSSAMTDSLVSNPRIDFAFSSCVDSLQVLSVDNLPEIIAGTTGTSTPRLCYSKFFYDTENNLDTLRIYEYGNNVPINFPEDHTGMFNSFVITINDSAFFPWDKNGGGHLEVINGDTIKVGGVDINTIFRHELGHICLGHELNEDLGDGTVEPMRRSLMMDGNAFECDSFPNFNYGTQEINGMKAAYNPPSLKALNCDNNVIIIGDSVTFEIEGTVDTRIDNLLYDNYEADGLFHCYLKYPYNLHPELSDPSHLSSISGYELFSEVLDSIEWINPDAYIAKSKYTFTPDSVGIYKFKVYTAMDWNTLGYLYLYELYPEQVRPYSEVEFRVVPRVDVWRASNKMDYTLESVNVFNAVCTDAYGEDYPYTEEMKFYYKEVGSEDAYTEIPEPPAKDLTVYSRIWDSGSLKGEYYVKATALYFESAESTDTLTWSDSLTIKLLDGFECDITEPRNYDVEAIDFEKIMKIGGRLHNDGTVNVDTLQLRDYIYDMQNNGRSIMTQDYADSLRVPKWKYLWYNIPLPWPYGTPLKKEGVKYNESLCISQSPVAEKSESKSLVYSDSITWNTGTNLGYSQSYYTSPGIYKVVGSAYDSEMNYPVAKTDTLWAMKPSWKMKLHGDYWYNNAPAYFFPYTNKTIYAPEQDIKMYVWRPFVGRSFESTNFRISYEGSEVANMTTVSADYQDYITEKPSYVNPVTGQWVMEPDTLKVSTVNPATWTRTGHESQGFYEITAKEYDPLTGVNVIQKEEIQIPPLYITAETDGYGWPVSLWPRGEGYEDMDNEDNWTVEFFNFKLPIGEKALCSYYRTMENKSCMELENLLTTIKKDFNVEFKYAIGLRTILEDDECVFEDLLADYTISISINGGVYKDLTSASVEKWTEYSSSLDNLQDSVYYFIGFTEPLHNQVSKESTIQVKLTTRGKVFTELNNTELNKDQRVMFDEISINYTRKECPEGPAFTKAEYVNTKGYDCVEISFNAPNGTVSPSGYNIYRNGIKIAHITGTSYTDLAIASGTTYNYSVTATYEGLDYPESSKLDCYFTVTTGQITYPRPRDFVLTQGSGYEYNNVYLEWTEPIIDSLVVYNIYRNDIIIARPDTTVFTDLWLNEGEYDYYITASYPDGGESVSTDTCSVEIAAGSTYLEPPLYDDFENGGIGPEYWESYYMSHPQYYEGKGEFVYATENSLGYSPYSGNYLAYIGTGPVKNNADYWEYESYDELRSPKFNLINYKNVTVSFRYMIQSNKYRGPFDSISLEFEKNNYNDDWSYYNSFKVGILYWESSIFDTIWQDFSYTFPDSILCEDSRIILHVYFENDFPSDYLYFSIDSLVISGTIKAEIPTGVQVSRDQGVTNVNWTGVQDATMYYVYRSDKPDVGYVEIGNTASTSFTDPDTELEDGVYFYKVVSEVTEKILSPGKVPLNRMKEVSR